MMEYVYGKLCMVGSGNGNLNNFLFVQIELVFGGVNNLIW